MGAQLRAVRRRIGAVQSTAKITRAQELIAASRIIKAQQRVRAAGPYAREITRGRGGGGQPVDADRPPADPGAGDTRAGRGADPDQRPRLRRRLQRQRAARGAAAAALLRDRGVEPVTYVAGRKGIGWHRFRELEMAGEWSGFSDAPRHRQRAARSAAALLEAFDRPTGEGGVDEIHLVHTEFVSMLTQRPVGPQDPAAGDRGDRPGAARPGRCRCTSSSRRRGRAGRAAAVVRGEPDLSTRCWRRRQRRSRRGGGR